jgi:hypothetical protein
MYKTDTIGTRVSITENLPLPTANFPNETKRYRENILLKQTAQNLVS